MSGKALICAGCGTLLALVIATGKGGADPPDPRLGPLQAPGADLWAPFAVADSKDEVRAKEAQLAANGRLRRVAPRLRPDGSSEQTPALEVGGLLVEVSYGWTHDDRLRSMWLVAEPALVREEMPLRGTAFERHAAQLTRVLTDLHGSARTVLGFPDRVPANLFDGPIGASEQLVSRWVHDRVIYDLKVAYRPSDATDEIRMFVAVFAYDNSLSGPWMDPWR